MKIFVTGGAGFIGSSVIRFLIQRTDHYVLNLDKLTYAGNLENLTSVSNDKRYEFVKGDICDRKLVEKLFYNFKPNVVMHLAAESHVDRSIKHPSKFITTNVNGTLTMLECARNYWNETKNTNKFIFQHISTDEVYGSLGSFGLFDEKSSYDPSSPYSASKASSDHLVRAWFRTFGLPVVITNCSNNYGPYQFPEKLIPVIILNAINKKSLPVYGSGKNIRDWLYVEDHARSLYLISRKGKIGETYNIGGNNEKSNIDVVKTICKILNKLKPINTTRNKKETITSYTDLIKFVPDRPGHDMRYALNTSKVNKELNWKPVESFETGLQKTIEWYLNNIDWCKNVLNNSHH